MTSLKLDPVFLLANPVLTDPLESLHLNLLESLLKHLLKNKTISNFEISFLRLRFLSSAQLQSVFDTLESVCKLVGVSSSDITLKFEDLDLLKTPEESYSEPRELPSYKPKPKSEFEFEMCNIFIPLLKYKKLFDVYGLEGSTNVLIHGPNSGNVFMNWFRSIQEEVNLDSEGKEGSRTLQLSMIRLSEILTPYFGESEQKLKFMFELSIENATDGVLCIFLEGLHNFSNSKETSHDLERRILSTLLLLLDGISRKRPRSDVSIVVVATTEEDPAFLDESLLRPGRLGRILEIVE